MTLLKSLRKRAREFLSYVKDAVRVHDMKKEK